MHDMILVAGFIGTVISVLLGMVAILRVLLKPIEHKVDMLEKSHGFLREEVREEFKEVREEFKEVRGEFKEVRKEIKDLREEVREEFKEVRKEIKDLREEVREEFKDLREEVKEEFREVREEVKEEFREVREEIKEEFNKVNSRLGNLEVGIAEVKTDIKYINKSVDTDSKLGFFFTEIKRNQHDKLEKRRIQ